MKPIYSLCRLLTKTVFFFITLHCHAQAPIWVFTPLSPTKLTLSKETTATVKYKITNQSIKKHSLALRPIAGVKQITTGSDCPNLFVLGFQESCTLTLQITGSYLQDDIVDGPWVCEQVNPLQCYQPSQPDILNITRSAGNFLVISDIHLDQDKASISYKEDTGTLLFSNTLSQLAQLISEQSPQFMVYLGDSPAHSQINRASNVQLVLEGLSRNAPSTPFFYVYGNNDSYNLGPNPTINYGPFSQDGVNLFNLDPAAAWPALNVITCPASTACINPTISPNMAFAQKYGFYSAYPLGSDTPLRFIAVNSVIFSYRYTGPLAIQQEEAQFELDWLAAQLQDAKMKNEQVFIAMHIPIGDVAVNPTHPDLWNTSILLNGNITPSLKGLTLRNAFLRLAADYKQTIRALITGHTHMEEYRVLYWGEAASYQPTVLNVGVPGITPLHLNNPGMQIYFHDTAFHLIDALTYYTTPEALPWLRFNFKSDYACPPRSTLFSCILSELIPNLDQGSKAVSQYKINYSVRSPIYAPEPATTWEEILKLIQVYPVA
ncbi:metallophosphoesterase [Legionella massiliensis]|uniref:metallophosphoesterase n=1 Tax=Legionella massiliensis TaxID=1034943 RepID=UPI00159EDCBD|nr:metallophosphoesterase [Legionella massiliensis]